MTVEIKLHRHEPESGKITSAVFLLHGYGADGRDLIGLAGPMSEHLPDCMFVAPDAPEACTVNPGGRQWFPIPSMDGASETAVASSLNSSLNILGSLIAQELRRVDLSESAALLFGFSQGTMVALHYSARHSRPFAGVIGFSGRLLAPERLENEAVSRPPVLLVHGDADPVVPYTCLGEAESALLSAGFTVQTHTSRGTAHGIAPDGLGMAIAFARSRLARVKFSRRPRPATPLCCF